MSQSIELGPAHTYFQAMAGEWTSVYTLVMGDKTLTFDGTQTTRLILGGLGMVYDTHVSMGSMTVMGHGSAFYVPAQGKYQVTWLDSMSHHGMWTGWGTWDAATQTMTEESQGPKADGELGRMRTVRAFTSDTAYTTTFFNVGTDGKAVQSMAIVSTRVL